MPLSIAVQAATVCEQPLAFEYRSGLFYSIDPEFGVRRAYTPDVFFATVAAAVECSRQHRPWERAPAEVVCLHQAATGKSSK